MDETSEDCVIFYLQVKPSTFDGYASRISAGTADEVILRVARVDGFYSEWSPSISTRNVKVLTRGREHSLQLPDDLEIEPLRLGSVGETALTINARRVQARKLSSDIDSDTADEEPQFTPLAQTEAAILRGGGDPQSIKLLESLKRATRWIIGLLVALVILTLLNSITRH